MGSGDYVAIAAGAANTIAISLLAIALGTPLGLGLALIRWRRLPGLDLVVAVLVSLLRATPAVTLVLLIYFALPTIGLEIPRFAAGVATLTLGTMAYNCEIWRATLLAFPIDQLDAARAFGMPATLRFRLVVLPQIVRAALPALVNEMTLIIKVSPAVAVIGVIEATRAAVRIGAATYNPIPPFTIDGEAVWCGADGVAVFESLHSRDHDAEVFLYAFDLLELEGEDWPPRPLEQRKDRLAKLIAGAPNGLQLREHIEGDGAAIFAHACKLGLEGIVSKRRDYPYRSGPSKAWIKVKNPNAPGVLRFEERES